MIQRAQNNLYLILSDLQNIGSPIWCIQKQLYTLTTGLSTLQLYPGTVDIRNALLRTTGTLTPDVGPTFTPTAITFDFHASGATLPNCMFLTWSGVPCAIAIQTSPTGLPGSWTTVSTAPVPYTGAPAGGYWYDLDGAVAALYWQIIPTLAGTTLTGTALTLNTNLSEILMARLNMDSYQNYPNKFFQGRPLQYWFDRQLIPIMHLWPTPDASNAASPVVVYRQRYIQDVGTQSQTLEVPQYWYEAITWQLAANLAWETPEADKVDPAMLDAKAQQMVNRAWMQDRDKSPIQLNYNIAPYTR